MAGELAGDRDNRGLPGVWVAPTEPVALRRIGKVGMVTERFGVDVMWSAKGKKWGVQRKEWKDLIASVEDGRLAREIPMMRALDVPWIVVEGWPQTANDGTIIDKRFGRAWSVQSIAKILWGMQVQGIAFDRTVDVAGTVQWVTAMVEWSRKDKHGSVMVRPGPTGMWGHRNDRDWGVHLLQGLDGVGVELAGRIWDHFGKVPWTWDVGVKELMEVPGIGKKKAEKMMRALDGKTDEKVEQ